MNQNFESYKDLTPGNKVVELRKLANEFGAQPSDVDTFLAGLVDSCDCQSGFANAVLKIFERAWKQADLKGMEMYMNLFRAFTGLEFTDFLNSAYMMATIRAQERAAADPQTWARIGKSRESDITDAHIVSRWKPDIVVVTPCRVDLRTRKVVEFYPVRCVNGDDPLEEENVKLQDVETPVWNIDTYVKCDNPANAYEELLRIQKSGNYWYSSSGLDLYEELIKGYEAVRAGLNNWDVPVYWVMSGYVRVKAASAEDAKRLVSEMKDKSVLPENGRCIGGGFDVEDDEEPYLVQSVSASKNESEREETTETPEVVEGRFISYWEDGNAIATGCKANLVAREILEIESCDDGADHGVCVDESVIIEDEESPVRNLDSIVEGECPGELYQILLNMKKNLTFWYSRSGLNLYEELVKARNAAYPLRLCNELSDNVTFTVEDVEHHFFEYHLDEDEVYIINRSGDDRGKRIGGVLADAVRLFAKNMIRQNPGLRDIPADFGN